MNEARGDAPTESASDELETVETVETVETTETIEESIEADDVADVAGALHPTPPSPVFSASPEATLPAAGAGEHDQPRESHVNHENHESHANHASHFDGPAGEALAPKNGHDGRTEEPQPGATLARGRFSGFYVPGQGSRGERTERVAPPIVQAPPVTPPVSAPPPAPRRMERPERGDRTMERAERAERMRRGTGPSVPGGALDEDDGQEYSGPRGDVRGSVGSLVDSLHELFARDRTIASQSSQGGVARCGVCYLHFPVGELTYREGEGFYVCASCAHALGSAHVPMVRRQQRQ